MHRCHSGLAPLRLGLFLLALLLPAAALAQTVTPSAPRLRDSQIERLEQGEKIITAEVDRINRAESVGLIDGSVAEVFAVLRDYDSFSRWYPDQVDSVLLSRSGSTGRARGEIHMPFPFPNRRYEIEVQHASREVEGHTVETLQWRYIEGTGNFAEMYGFWWIQPWQGATDRTLVRYVLYADLGTWLPDFVIRWAQRRMLPGIIDGIRSEVVRRR